MCGRYVSPEQAEFERFWHIGRHNSNPFSRRFNVAPTTQVPIIYPSDDGIEMGLARWGLIPFWWKDAKPPRLTFNARSEEAAIKPMWRHPASEARCLVPALGWYEWQEIDRVDPSTGEVTKAKQPYFIRLPDGKPIAFAGLMSRRNIEGDKAEFTCAIMTRDAVGPAAEVHTRMPVALPKNAESPWLVSDMTDAAAAIEFARKNSVTEFVHHSVDPRVNNARNEGADLIEPFKKPA